MSFAPINQEMAEAQVQLEAKIQDVISLTNELFLAKVEHMKKDSELRAAKLEMKAIEEKIKTIREVGWNERAQSKL